MNSPEISGNTPEAKPRIPAALKLLGAGALLGTGLVLAGVTHLGEGLLAFSAAPAVGEGIGHLVEHFPLRRS